MPVQQIESEIQGFKIGNYLLREKIGAGSFSTVFRAKHTEFEKYFAVKRLSKELIKQNNMKSTVETEITIMGNIDHQNILKLYDVLESKTNYYLVLQHCRGGDLEQFLKGLKIDKFVSESQAIFFLKQLVNGFQVLREHNVIHRDLKLANIFIDKDRLVIGDFGLATLADVAGTRLGSLITMAPEVMDKNNTEGYDAKADLWSLGVVFYQILFKRHPFEANTLQELVQAIREKSGENLSFPSETSLPIQRLLKNMLQENPKNRYSWEQLFEHPVFSDFIQGGSEKTFVSILRQLGQQVDFRNSIEGEFDSNRRKTCGGTKNRMKLEPTRKKVPVTLVGEEVEVSPVEKVQIELNIANNEIKFRYFHESNMMVFMVSTVKRVQEICKQLKDGPIFEMFFNASRILMKKIVLKNSDICKSLKQSINLLSVDQANFERFLSSPQVKETLSAFESVQGSFEHYFEHLNAKAPPFIKQTESIESAMAASVIKLAELDSILSRKIEKIKIFLQTSYDALPSKHQREVLLSSVAIKLCQNTDLYFPYFPDLENLGSTFNWEIFSQKFLEMDEENLAAVINA